MYFLCRDKKCIFETGIFLNKFFSVTTLYVSDEHFKKITSYASASALRVVSRVLFLANSHHHIHSRSWSESNTHIISSPHSPLKIQVGSYLLPYCIHLSFHLIGLMKH